MVFYRKYRSQTIDELDITAVREALLAVLSNPPHAFLFTGPKGLGKTSTARIIAKVVNCELRSKIKDQRSKTQLKTPTDAKALAGKQNLENSNKIKSADQIEPCNKCEQCISITNGTNMDVIEIDAASNRGIDEIRDLREKIWLSPLSAAKKVYIIDEVHMLTTEAFNALLKILEEPPAHAMFILCTTEPHKVPSTILSRCFHVQFKLATDDEIVRSLRRIAAGEKLQIDDDAMYMIAKSAEGGFRDAAKILEEIVGLAAGTRITKELVDEKYKVSSIKYKVLELFRSLQVRDAKAGIKLVQSLVDEGIDLKFFLLQLMEILHQALLLGAGVRKFEKNDISLTNEEIGVLFILFSKVNSEMKFAVLPQLPLERG